jgi:hypothetical protein
MTLDQWELKRKAFKTVLQLRRSNYNPRLGQQVVDDLIRSHLGYLDEHIIGQVHDVTSSQNVRCRTASKDLEDTVMIMRGQLECVGPNAYEKLLREAAGEGADNNVNRAKLALAALIHSAGLTGRLQAGDVEYAFKQRADYITPQFMSDLRVETWKNQGIELDASSPWSVSSPITEFILSMLSAGWCSCTTTFH